MKCFVAKKKEHRKQKELNKTNSVLNKIKFGETKVR
jgi:hypothetical protein